MSRAAFLVLFVCACSSASPRGHMQPSRARELFEPPLARLVADVDATVPDFPASAAELDAGVSRELRRELDAGAELDAGDPPAHPDAGRDAGHDAGRPAPCICGTPCMPYGSSFTCQ